MNYQLLQGLGHIFTGKWPFHKEITEDWESLQRYLDRASGLLESSPMLSHFLSLVRSGQPAMLVNFGYSEPESVERVRHAIGSIQELVSQKQPELSARLGTTSELYWFVPVDVPPQEVLPQQRSEEPWTQAVHTYFRMQPYLRLWNIRVLQDKELVPDIHRPIGVAWVSAADPSSRDIIQSELESVVRRHYSQLAPAFLAASGLLRFYAEEFVENLSTSQLVGTAEAYLPALLKPVHAEETVPSAQAAAPLTLSTASGGSWVLPTGEMRVVSLRPGWFGKLPSGEVPEPPIGLGAWFYRNLREAIGRVVSVQEQIARGERKPEEILDEVSNVQLLGDLTPEQRLATFLCTESSQRLGADFSCMSPISSEMYSPRTAIPLFSQEIGGPTFYTSFARQTRKGSIINEPLPYDVRFVEGKTLEGVPFFEQLYSVRQVLNFGQVPQRVRTEAEIGTALQQVFRGKIPLQAVISPAHVGIPGWSSGESAQAINIALAHGDLSALEEYQDLLRATVALRMRVKPAEVWGPQLATIRDPTGRSVPADVEYNFYFEPRWFFQDVAPVWNMLALGSEIQSAVRHVGRGLLPESLPKTPVGPDEDQQSEHVVYLPAIALREIAARGRISHTGVGFLFPEVYAAALHAVGLYGEPIRAAPVRELIPRLFGPGGLSALAETIQKYSGVQVQYQPVQPEEVHQVSPHRVYMIPILGALESAAARWGYSDLEVVPRSGSSSLLTFSQKNVYRGASAPYREVHHRLDRLRYYLPYEDVISIVQEGAPRYAIPLPLVVAHGSSPVLRKAVGIETLSEALRSGLSRAISERARRTILESLISFPRSEEESNAEAVVLGDVERVLMGTDISRENIQEARHRLALFAQGLMEHLGPHGFMYAYAMPTGMEWPSSDVSEKIVPVEREPGSALRTLFGRYYVTLDVVPPESGLPVLVGLATRKGAEFLAYRSTLPFALSTPPAAYALGVTAPFREIAAVAGKEIRAEPAFSVATFLGHWDPRALGVEPAKYREVPSWSYPALMANIPQLAEQLRIKRPQLEFAFQEAIRHGLRAPWSYLTSWQKAGLPAGLLGEPADKWVQSVPVESPTEMQLVRIGKPVPPNALEGILDAILITVFPEYREYLSEHLRGASTPIASLRSEKVKPPARTFDLSAMRDVPVDQRLYLLVPGMRLLAKTPSNVNVYEATLYTHTETDLGPPSMATAVLETASPESSRYFYESLLVIPGTALQTAMTNPKALETLLARLKGLMGKEAIGEGAYYPYGLIPWYAQKPGQEAVGMITTPASRETVLRSMGLAPKSGLVIPAAVGFYHRPVGEASSYEEITVTPVVLQTLHRYLPGSRLVPLPGYSEERMSTIFPVPASVGMETELSVPDPYQTMFFALTDDIPLPKSAVQELLAEKGQGLALSLHDVPVDLPHGTHMAMYTAPGYLPDPGARERFIPIIVWGNKTIPHRILAVEVAQGRGVMAPFLIPVAPDEESRVSGPLQTVILYPGVSQETASSLHEAVVMAIRGPELDIIPHRHMRDVQGEILRISGSDLQAFWPVQVRGGETTIRSVFAKVAHPKKTSASPESSSSGSSGSSGSPTRHS